MGELDSLHCSNTEAPRPSLRENIKICTRVYMMWVNNVN